MGIQQGLIQWIAIYINTGCYTLGEMHTQPKPFTFQKIGSRQRGRVSLKDGYRRLGDTISWRAEASRQALSLIMNNDAKGFFFYLVLNSAFSNTLSLPV